MKRPWQETVIEIGNVQRKHSLSVRTCAERFNISRGKAGMDINLAIALKVYPKLAEIKNYVDAVKFLKKKKFNRKLKMN